MTKATMPEPVGHAHRDILRRDSGVERLYRHPRYGAEGLALITTEQAEAYATAKVREALEEAASVAMNAPITADMVESDDAKAVSFHASARIRALIQTTPA